LSSHRRTFWPSYRREPETVSIEFALVDPSTDDYLWETLEDQDGLVWEYLDQASTVWINSDYDTLGPIIVLVESDDETTYTARAYDKGAAVGEVKLPITEDWFAGPYDTACKAWAQLLALTSP
jgi:hypothetical protein